MIDYEPYHTPESVRREFRPAEVVERTPLLDNPSKSRPILDYNFHEALTNIMLVSDGAVMALVERVKGSKAGSIAPQSVLEMIVEKLEKQYAECRTHRARLDTIKAARHVGVRLRYAPDRSKVHGTREWREAIAHDPRDNATIALDHGITDRTVRNIRKQFGVSRPHGRPKTEATCKVE